MVFVLIILKNVLLLFFVLKVILDVKIIHVLKIRKNVNLMKEIIKLLVLLINQFYVMITHVLMRKVNVMEEYQFVLLIFLINAGIMNVGKILKIVLLKFLVLMIILFYVLMVLVRKLIIIVLINKLMIIIMIYHQIYLDVIMVRKDIHFYYVLLIHLVVKILLNAGMVLVLIILVIVLIFLINVLKIILLDVMMVLVDLILKAVQLLVFVLLKLLLNALIILVEVH